MCMWCVYMLWLGQGLWLELGPCCVHVVCVYVIARARIMVRARAMLCACGVCICYS